MPPPPRSLTSDQIALIARWIREGARNRDCSNDTAGCDTTNVTYATHIQPIMQRACTGCHSGSNPSASINLTDRTVVASMATSGRLYGSMAHLAGFAAMPPSGGKVDDCTLATIQAWKQQGLR
jgi:cytochrome c5